MALRSRGAFMKIQKITSLIIALSFISFGLASPGLAAGPVHAPVISHPHPSEHEAVHPVEQHVVTEHTVTTVTHTVTEHVATEKVQKKPSPKSPVVTKETKTNNVKSTQKVEVSEHATKVAAVVPVKPITPSTGAAKASVDKLFSEHTNTKSLNGYQIINLSGNQNLKGQQAAMVAALVVQINNSMTANSKLTPKDVTYTQAELAKKFADKNSAFYISYVNALNKINQVKALPPSQQLFGPHELTANTKIIQGSAGDCFFLSAINGLLKVPGGPQALKNMITRIPGQPDEFSVKFPGDTAPVTVKLNDAEIGMYSHIEQGGKWLAVLSVAEDMNRHKAHLDTQATIGGGMPEQTLGLFTGKKYVAERLPAATPTPAQAQNIVNKIRVAEKNGMPIAINTNDHVLAIMGCEHCVVTKNAAGQVTSVTGNVLIKNPWGTNGVWYNPKSGTWSDNKNSIADPKYLMSDNGEFKVPLDQISNGFLDIVYHPEDAKELTPSSI